MEININKLPVTLLMAWRLNDLTIIHKYKEMQLLVMRVPDGVITLLSGELSGSLGLTGK